MQITILQACYISLCLEWGQPHKMIANIYLLPLNINSKLSKLLSNIRQKLIQFGLYHAAQKNLLPNSDMFSFKTEIL